MEVKFNKELLNDSVKYLISFLDEVEKDCEVRSDELKNTSPLESIDFWLTKTYVVALKIAIEGLKNSALQYDSKLPLEVNTPFEIIKSIYFNFNPTENLVQSIAEWKEVENRKNQIKLEKDQMNVRLNIELKERFKNSLGGDL